MPGAHSARGGLQSPRQPAGSSPAAGRAAADQAPQAGAPPGSPPISARSFLDGGAQAGVEHQEARLPAEPAAGSSLALWAKGDSEEGCGMEDWLDEEVEGHDEPPVILKRGGAGHRQSPADVGAAAPRPGGGSEPTQATAPFLEAETPAPARRREPDTGAPQQRGLQTVLERQAALEKQTAHVSRRMAMTKGLMEGQLRLAQILTQLAESMNAQEKQEARECGLTCGKLRVGDGLAKSDVDYIKPLYAADSGSPDRARGGHKDGHRHRLREPEPAGDFSEYTEESEDWVYDLEPGSERAPAKGHQLDWRAPGEDSGENGEPLCHGEEAATGIHKRRGSVGSHDSMADILGEMINERREAMHHRHDGNGGIYTLAWYADIYSTVSFALACSLMFYFWVTLPNGEAFVMTMFTTAIASLASFAKACGMGDYEIWGELIPFARYIDWITTTPMMLYELCHIAHASAGQIILVVGCDLMMLATGIIAAFIPWNPHKWLKNAWFGFSCFFYILMLVVLQVDVAKEAEKQNPKAARLFTDLQVLTKVVWSFYPLVVAVGRAHIGLISKPMEDILLCILDTVAKIGMEGFIVASCINGCA